MRAVDTSAWIEWLAESNPGMAVAAQLPEQVDWLVPTIVQMELAKWGERTGGEKAADRLIASSDKCVIAVLDTKTAVHAAQLSAAHKLSTADAIIYATALAYGADLLTCDSHFQGLPNVRYIPKHVR